MSAGLLRSKYLANCTTYGLRRRNALAIPLQAVEARFVVEEMGFEVQWNVKHG